MNIDVVYEDKYILIMDKPAGVPCHMIHLQDQGTLVNFLLEYYPAIKGVGFSVLESGLVHRLDTNTSGLVLAVKDKASFTNLREQFREKKVLKEYLALAHGRYQGPRLMSRYIGPDPKNKKKVKILTAADKSVRQAVTEIIDKKYPARRRDYTLVRLIIKTGVRHQIRAQLAAQGHPLVGDLIYQNLKTKQKDQLGLTRHFLHATRLGFYHPKTKRWLEQKAALPQELALRIEELGIK